MFKADFETQVIEAIRSGSQPHDRVSITGRGQGVGDFAQCVQALVIY
jgi:hypothetical protein